VGRILSKSREKGIEKGPVQKKQKPTKGSSKQKSSCYRSLVVLTDRARTSGQGRWKKSYTRRVVQL